MLVLPLRNPLVLARQVLAIQALSSGRLVLGIGVGDYQAEFEALEIPYGQRGKMTDEYLDVVLQALRDGVLQYEGKYIRCERAHFYPRMDVPPVLIGGGIIPGPEAADDRLVEAVLRRIARFGGGWLLDWGDPPLIAAGAERIRHLAHGYGQDGLDVDIGVSTQLFIDDTDAKARKWTERSVRGAAAASSGAQGRCGRRSPDRIFGRSLIGSPATVTGRIQTYAESGVTRFVMTCLAPDLRTFSEMIARFSAEVRPAFQ